MANLSKTNSSRANSNYYPIFLDIKDKHCLVVGGGKVAERKINGLIDRGAKVTVISSKISENIKKLAKKRQNSKKITLITSNYKKNTIKNAENGYFLVISATNSSKTNELVSLEAEEQGIPVNVADIPELCTFILPAIVSRGDFQIAVSTGGKSPYLAKALKNMFEEDLPEEFATYVDLIGAIRYKLLKKDDKNDRNDRLDKDKIFDTLINSPLLEWIVEATVKKKTTKQDSLDQKNACRKINKFLKDLLGVGYSLSKLGIKF